RPEDRRAADAPRAVHGRPHPSRISGGGDSAWQLHSRASAERGRRPLGRGGGARPMSSFDPVTLAVIANRLDSIVREMENTLLRTGRSAVLNMARDFSCALITADNRLLASAEGL